MQKLIKDNAVISDSWTLIHDEDLSAIPTDSAAIIPLPLWKANQPELSGRADIGVWVANDTPIEELESIADQLPLIAINFPTFMDGRGFSIARVLRDRIGFTGELRAIGHVIRDQLFYLKRCGFNAYILPHHYDLEAALGSLNDFSETYQPACDQPLPLFRRKAI